MQHELTGSLPKSLSKWIKSSGGCLIWTGLKNRNGYGRVKFRGRWYFTHRLVYTITRGEIPKGWVIHHTCFHHSCCRPAHLRAMTRKGHKQLHARLHAQRVAVKSTNR